MAPLRTDLLRHFNTVHQRLRKYLRRHLCSIAGANFDQLRANGYFRHGWWGGRIPQIETLDTHTQKDSYPQGCGSGVIQSGSSILPRSGSTKFLNPDPMQIRKRIHKGKCAETF
jgi:hypothetical protein